MCVCEECEGRGGERSEGEYEETGGGRGVRGHVMGGEKSQGWRGM